MKNFKELDKREISEVEKDILDSWKDLDILNKSTNKGTNDFVFYDTPRTCKSNKRLIY